MSYVVWNIALNGEEPKLEYNMCNKDNDIVLDV